MHKPWTVGCSRRDSYDKKDQCAPVGTLDINELLR
jgi:hypothetical protein